LPYAERLKRLDLASLELRRLHADLIFCYKIVFSLTDLQFSEFFETATLSITRGHNHKLFKKRCSADIRSKFFSERVVNCWNDLPVTVDFSSLTIDSVTKLCAPTNWWSAAALGGLMTGAPRIFHRRRRRGFMVGGGGVRPNERTLKQRIYWTGVFSWFYRGQPLHL